MKSERFAPPPPFASDRPGESHSVELIRRHGTVSFALGALMWGPVGFALGAVAMWLFTVYGG